MDLAVRLRATTRELDALAHAARDRLSADDPVRAAIADAQVQLHLAVTAWEHPLLHAVNPPVGDDAVYMLPDEA